MDAKKLEIMMTAIDLGSFSAASEVVGYTQSGLTHLCDMLEREIGVRIVKRNHSGVTLTEQGAVLMPAIRDFLRANANLENKIRDLKSEQTDTVRVAAYASIAMHWMPEILYRFHRAYPSLAVDLRMVDHALEPFELLDKGEVDLIFAGKQSGMNCAWKTLYREKMFAVLPRNYPTGESRTFPLTAFQDTEFLMPYGRFDLDVNAALAKTGTSVKVRAAKVDDETVIRLVGKGMGISMMTELMIRGRTDEVICLPVEPECVRELGVGWIGRPRPNENALRLMDTITDYLEEICRDGEKKPLFTR